MYSGTLKEARGDHDLRQEAQGTAWFDAERNNETDRL